MVYIPSFVEISVITGLCQKEKAKDKIEPEFYNSLLFQASWILIFIK